MSRYIYENIYERIVTTTQRGVSNTENKTQPTFKQKLFRSQTDQQTENTYILKTKQINNI